MSQPHNQLWPTQKKKNHQRSKHGPQTTPQSTQSKAQHQGQETCRSPKSPGHGRSGRTCREQPPCPKRSENQSQKQQEQDDAEDEMANVSSDDSIFRDMAGPNPHKKLIDHFLVLPHTATTANPETSYVLWAVRIRTLLVMRTCDGRPKQSQMGEDQGKWQWVELAGRGKVDGWW